MTDRGKKPNTLPGNVIWAPLGISRDTLVDGSYHIDSIDGQYQVIYCPRHKCGALYDERKQVWHCFMPITPDDLITWLDAAFVQLPGGQVFRDWWIAIGGHYPDDGRTN